MLTIAILLSSMVMGAHVWVPILLARREPSAAEESPARRKWALVAAPLLLTSGISWLVVQSWSPNLGLTTVEGSSTGPALASLPLETKLAALLFVSLLVTDLLVLFAWSKLDRNAWLLVAAIGLTALIGTTYAFNSIAFRLDPPSLAVVAETQGDFYIETSNLNSVPGGSVGTLIRSFLLSLLSLSAARILSFGIFTGDEESRQWIRFLPLLAALSMVAYVFVLPPNVRSTLVQHQDHLTGLSAAALLAIQPWLPTSIRWPSLFLAMSLLALLLARIVVVAG